MEPVFLAARAAGELLAHGLAMDACTGYGVYVSLARIRRVTLLTRLYKTMACCFYRDSFSCKCRAHSLPCGSSWGCPCRAESDPSNLIRLIPV